MRVALPLTLVPAELASCTRKRSPLIERAGLASVSVAVVEPLKVALLLRLLHVAPASTDVCHW